MLYVITGLIKILITMTIIVLLLTTILDALFYYFDDDLLKYPKIKFKSFEKFYVVNPNRWELKDDYIICIYDNRYSNEYERYGYYNNERIKLRFGYLETYRYRYWLNTKKEKIKNQEDVESISKVLTVVKSDIEKLEKDAEREINKGIKMHNQVLKNLTNEDIERLR